MVLLVVAADGAEVASDAGSDGGTSSFCARDGFSLKNYVKIDLQIIKVDRREEKEKKRFEYPFKFFSKLAFRMSFSSSTEKTH